MSIHIFNIYLAVRSTVVGLDAGPGREHVGAVPVCPELAMGPCGYWRVEPDETWDCVLGGEETASSCEVQRKDVGGEGAH